MSLHLYPDVQRKQTEGGTSEPDGKNIRKIIKRTCPDPGFAIS
jgi:hypothetical protein